MSEIKVGDRVRVYGYVVGDSETSQIVNYAINYAINYANGHIGTVFEVNEHGFGLDININSNSLKIYPHPKQCRKLVKKKMITCTYCTLIPYRGFFLQKECPACNGKGKIKICLG